jgi:hypothetical protein
MDNRKEIELFIGKQDSNGKKLAKDREYDKTKANW